MSIHCFFAELFSIRSFYHPKWTASQAMNTPGPIIQEVEEDIEERAEEGTGAASSTSAAISKPKDTRVRNGRKRQELNV